MRRLPFISNELINSQSDFASDTDYCPVCLDKYNYKPLIIHNYTSIQFQLLHQAIQFILESPRSLVLRPLMLTSFMVGGGLLTTLMNYFVHSRYFHQFIFIASSIYNSITLAVTSDPPLFVSISQLFKDLLLSTSPMRTLWSDIIQSSSALRGYSSASFDNILTRFLTSRWFWQQVCKYIC